MKKDIKFSMALAAFLFGVGGTNFASADVYVSGDVKKDGTSAYYNFTPKTNDAPKTYIPNNNTVNVGSTDTGEGILVERHTKDFIIGVRNNAKEDAENVENNAILVDSVGSDYASGTIVPSYQIRANNLTKKEDDGTTTILGGGGDAINNSIAITSSGFANANINTADGAVSDNLIEIYGGNATGGANIKSTKANATNNSITIANKSNLATASIGAGTSGDVTDNTIVIDDSSTLTGAITINTGDGVATNNKVAVSSGSTTGVITISSKNAEATNNSIVITDSTATGNVGIKQTGNDEGAVTNNNIEIKDSKIRNAQMTSTNGDITNNHIEIEGSDFRMASMSAQKGSTRYNTIFVNSVKPTELINFRAGQVVLGDTEYNTFWVKDSILTGVTNTTFNITAGLSQKSDGVMNTGNAKYNQLIFQNTIMSENTAIHGMYAGRIQNGDDKELDRQVIGNRIVIDNFNFGRSKGIMAGGAAGIFSNGTDYYSGDGDGEYNVKVNDNIATIKGASQVEHIYGAWIQGLTGDKYEANNNIVVLNLSNGKVGKNAYAAFVQDSEEFTEEKEQDKLDADGNPVLDADGNTEKEIVQVTLPASNPSEFAETNNNAVYFLKGEVGGVVGGGNGEKASNDNALIIGHSVSEFGTRSAGKIENFNDLDFAVIQGTKDDERETAALILTGESSDLTDMSVKFLSSDGEKSVKVAVGGSNGEGVDDVRDSDGGGEKAISKLTAKYTQYNAKDTEKITLINSLEISDITEELIKKSDGSTQSTYNIGDEYKFSYTELEFEPETKYYLIDSSEVLENWEKLANYNSELGAAGEEVEHWDGTTGKVVDAYQTNNEYVIDNAKTFTRNIRGMFVSTDEKSLYITGNADIKETIGDTIGGDDFFTKFGGDKSGNTIKLVPGEDGLDLGEVTLDGGSGDNKLQIGDSDNKAKTNQIKVKDVTDFEEIEMNVGKVSDDDVIIELTDGSNTDLSKSSVTVNIDDVSELDKGPVHVFKTSSGNDIAKNADSMTVNIGTTTTLTFEQEASGDHFDLVIPEEEDDTPADDTPADDTPADDTPADDTPADKPTPTPTTTTNPQTKIFNEARIAGLAAVWEGSYLISNHLDRIIPDAFSELFPYAIVEGYDKRYKTGSHVDALGFNANAGLASKGANSSGEFTMGAFVEYGISKYDAYLDDGTTGDGKNYYMGGGFFGKQENNSGSYFEGTFRIGQLVTDFDGDIDKKHYDFDVKSTYIAAHAGLGKVFALTQSNDLDIYARYFYTHVESAEVKLNDGTDLKFDSAQSNKIRVGLKDDFKLDDNNKLYVGAAYEYEFDAKAGARLFVPGYNTQGELLSPSLKGSTGIGEIGYEYKNDKIKFDAGVKGYVGKQQGVSAQMAISIAF